MSFKSGKRQSLKRKVLEELWLVKILFTYVRLDFKFKDSIF